MDVGTLLREVKWVVETTKLAMKESKNDGAGKSRARTSVGAHAEQLRTENGLTVPRRCCSIR